MVRLPPLLGVRDLLRLYKVRARKQLSQNFLLDPTITGRFVSKARANGCHVIEVGPGPGTLTRALLASDPQSLVVVEKDERFLPLLENLADAFHPSERRLKIIQGDIRTFDWEQADVPEDAFREWGNAELPPVRIIGNLPFSIATHLVIEWLFLISERKGPWKFGRVPMTLSFQDEVAQRIVAKPGTREWCRLSVMCQSLCQVSYGMKILGGSFVPAPDVNAGVVVMTPRVEPLVPVDEFGLKFFEKVVRDIFNRKNATCARGLGNLVPMKLRKLIVPSILALAEIEHGRNWFEKAPPPSFLTTEQFGAIASALKRWHAAIPEIADYSYQSPKATRTDGAHLIPEVEAFLAQLEAETADQVAGSVPLAA